MTRTTRDVYAVQALRSPVGRYGGQLGSVRPDDLVAQVIGAALERTDLDPEAVDDVILGCANQAGEDSRNIARNAALLAGLPGEIPGQTVNRLCGSGMQAVIAAAREIQVGAADVIVAGGVESMSRAPWVMAKPERLPTRGTQSLEDSALGWRMMNPRMRELGASMSLGQTAENVASRYGVTREDQDAWALRSHERAVAAQRSGRFDEELVPITVKSPKGEERLAETDEGPRSDSSHEKLASLRAAFVEDGTVTAGNSSPLNDGATVVILMSGDACGRHGQTPLSRFVDGASVGVDPAYMGIGPVPAVRRLLARPGMAPLSRFDHFEINEAFASQAVASVQELKLDPDRVNVNGGAIALGHPLGSSGARIATTLMHEMKRQESGLGLAAMCVGVGQGIATAWENVSTRSDG